MDNKKQQPIDLMNDQFIGLDNNTESNHASDLSDNTTSNPTDNILDNPESVTTKSANKDYKQRSPTPSHLITVDLTDKKSPIILLFGAPSSGKTMTLVRLAKYLRPRGYQLVVDANFCGNAWEYQENMNNFNSMLNTNYALKGTGRNDFLLVKILDSQGNTICQILEGAGEDYFPSNIVSGIHRSRVPFPAYMTTVFASTNKKIWMFLTEPNWQQDRAEYVDRIKFCKQQHFGRRDKCIIVYNKIDTTPFSTGDTINTRAASEQCNDEYPGIFSLFPTHSPLPRFLTEPYACKFVPFSTGTYGIPIPGQLSHYVPSREIHPARLWDTIMKCIKG